MADYAIETASLRKEYGRLLNADRRFVAVEDLTLAVPRGQIFGFLGPNGAGKTTTINMLIGNVSPTSGSAKLLGKPIGNREARRKLGFLPEKFQFHDFLNAEEFLDLHGTLYGMSQADRRSRTAETLKLVGLYDRRKSRLREFSKGMQQRAGLAQAILNNPDLVILDEPTSALDPLGRRLVRDVLRGLRDQGKTVFLNSHLLSEIEMTCDQVAIIRGGRVIRMGRITDLVEEHARVEVRIDNDSEALRLAISTLATSIAGTDNRLLVSLRSIDDVPELASLIVANGGRLRALIPERETLEELFIRVVEE